MLTPWGTEGMNSRAVLINPAQDPPAPTGHVVKSCLGQLVASAATSKPLKLKLLVVSNRSSAIFEGLVYPPRQDCPRRDPLPLVLPPPAFF